MRTRAVLLAIAALSAGSSIEQFAADNMAPILVNTKDRFNREPIPRFAREAAPGLIAVLDGIVATSPENSELLLLQAEMNATFAFAFLNDEDPAWATAFYQKAQVAALAALAEEDDQLAEDLLGAPAASLLGVLREADAEDVLPAVFWWAFAAGAEINLHRSDPARIAQLDRVDEAMAWVVEESPGFFNAGPHLYFAMRRCALPASLGGDPEEGLRHFEAVDRITSSKMLMSPVYKAEFYAPGLAATPAGADIDEVKAAQRRAWDSWFGTLKAVVETPVDIWPEQTLPNAVARERALRLLADPEGHNIIPPPGVENPYQGGAESGDWGEDDGGAWEEGAWDEGN
jgi:hypothetical protein